MAYVPFTDERGESYFIDWDIVYRILHAYHLANERDRQSRVVRDVEPGVSGWFLPAIESVEVPWHQVRSKATANADHDFDRFSEVWVRDVRILHRSLTGFTRATETATARFRDLMASTQSENMARVNSAVRLNEAGEGIARFFRDTAAEGLVIGSTLLTGGAAAPALAALGGGSALKGVGKYQDSGNVGSAFVTGTGTFIFGLFKVGGTKLSRAEEAAVVVVQAQWETMNALVDGKSMSEALAKGGAKLTGPFVDRLTKLPGVLPLFARAAAPLNITVAKYATDNIAAEVVRKTISKVGQKAVDKAVGVLAAPAKGAPPPAALASSANASPLQSAMFTEGQMLLNLAVISERKGLGNGI
jgi:hypothetical protein